MLTVPTVLNFLFLLTLIIILYLSRFSDDVGAVSVSYCMVFKVKCHLIWQCSWMDRCGKKCFLVKGGLTLWFLKIVFI